MADFIAVIRRAVDGLSENTPEMRAKVYERAKSAVVRQLENMKPRPPEAMFQRQIDKLDAAIREVEAEHAEALPADDVSVAATEEPKQAAPAPEPAMAAAVEEKPAAEPLRQTIPEPEPAPIVQRELVPDSLMAPTQARRQEPAKAAAVMEPVLEAPVEAAPEPVAETVKAPEPSPVFETEPAIPAYVTSEAPAAEPEAKLTPEAHPVQLDVKPYEAAPEISQQDTATYEPAPAEAYAAPAEPVYEPVIQPAVAMKPVIEEKPAPIPVQQTIESELAAKRPVAEEGRQWSVDIDAEPEVADAKPEAGEPPPMPKVSYDETDVVAGFNDFLKEELNRKVVPPPPQAKAKKQDDFSWDAPFDDLPEIPKPETFEKALEAKQKEIAGEKRNGKNRQQKTEPISARAELETMLGIEPATVAGRVQSWGLNPLRPAAVVPPAGAAPPPASPGPQSPPPPSPAAAAPP